MGPTVFISADAIEHNLRHLAEVAGGRPAFPVIKANAYGHDAEQVAAMLAGRFSLHEIPMFCVARSVELAKLLPLKFLQDFLVLSQIDWEWHLANPVEGRVIWTLGSLADLKAWRSKAKSTGSLNRVHLKINSGMNRLGLSLEELKILLPLLKTCISEGLCLEGVYTHFWNSDANSEQDSADQLKVFANAVSLLDEQKLISSSTWIHAENSAALRWHLALPNVGRSAFRPGIHLWGYGLNQDYHSKDSVCAKLRPAFAVGAPVRQVRMLSQGEGLSYGWRFKASQLQTWVASVPLGYADGIPRSLSWNGEGAPRGWLVIHGKKCPIVSTVTMDMVMVQLDDTTASKLREQDSETFAYWIHPEHQSVPDVAQVLGTITYEVLCMVSARVPRTMRDSLEDLL